MQNLVFREAENNNIPAIVNIHNSSVRRKPGWWGQLRRFLGMSLPDRGFLLTPTTEEEVSQKLASSARYFVATNSDHKVVGFVTLLQPIISDAMLNQMIWKDESFKTKIANENHFYINIVATRLDCMGKGVARFMYESLYQLFPNAYFSAFVVTQPIINNRSLIFHQKQGFEQIGVFRSEKVLDLENYESVLFFKEINYRLSSRL